nr:hypothetical protein [Clostridium sp. AM45-5]
MGRRRIWLIIIGILIAGVSITWAVERFVSSRGVDTAAVVGFEADALPQGPVDAGNPYAAENKMKAAGTPDPQTPEDAEVSALQWQRMRWQWRRAKQGQRRRAQQKICRLLRRL